MPSAVILRLSLVVFGGAALGALLGWFGQCSSGTCPLAATWWRSALYGGFLGLIATLSAPRAG